MKTKILLSLIAFAATAALAQPAAHADGQRFIMAPNYWLKEQSVRRNSYNNLAPAAATVRAGSTPRGSSVIGIDLARLKRAPAQMQMPPAMQPTVMAQIAPGLNPSAFNPAFGKAMLPMTAKAQALPQTSQLAPANTRNTVPASKTLSHTQNAYPKMRKHTNSSNSPREAARFSQIKNYPSGFESGPTNPSTFGSDVNVEQRVGGKVISK